MANVLGRIDPKTGKIREYPLKTPHCGPHGLDEDQRGNIWFTGNTGALIGKLDPKTGTVTEYNLPDPNAQDPHTLIFDRSGILWFTVQNANRIGRLEPKTGQSLTALRPSRVSYSEASQAQRPKRSCASIREAPDCRDGPSRVAATSCATRRSRETAASCWPTAWSMP